MMTGKEALIAFLDGKEVEFKDVTNTWHKAHSGLTLDVVSRYQFRLKPRTITINGIEVPTCGEKYIPHTFMFVLNSLEPCEYSKIILDESDEIPPYWWSTEEEIKQVVAALRSIFK